METFVAAYIIVMLAMASYVLRLRGIQRGLEQRAHELEARSLEGNWDGGVPFLPDEGR